MRYEARAWRPHKVNSIETHTHINYASQAFAIDTAINKYLYEYVEICLRKINCKRMNSNRSSSAESRIDSVSNSSHSCK